MLVARGQRARQLRRDLRFQVHVGRLVAAAVLAGVDGAESRRGADGRGRPAFTGGVRSKAEAAVSADPRLVPGEHIDEDPANPRAEFSDAELGALAADIRMRGILVPLVVAGTLLSGMSTSVVTPPAAAARVAVWNQSFLRRGAKAVWKMQAC